MKTIFTFLSAFTLTASIAIAQSSNNVVIFNQDGDRFYVILNGVKQNPNPETNVKIVDLTQPNYKVKIVFENKSILDLDKNLYLMWEGEEKNGWEFNYNISKTPKGYKLREISAAPYTTQAAPAQGQVIYVFTTAMPVQYGTVSTTSKTTKSTSTTVDGINDNVSINVNVGGVGVDMNVNVNDQQDNMSSSHTTTTTTSSTTTASNTDHYIMNGYNGAIGCSWPMKPADFESAKQSVKSKGFDDSRLTIAKQIIGSNCLLASQIKELMILMSFEETKLDLAKYSYKRTFDQGNYFKLNDAFQFESSIDELNQYINGK